MLRGSFVGVLDIELMADLQPRCLLRVMCGRIWTPPDCNTLIGFGATVTTADVRLSLCCAHNASRSSCCQRLITPATAAPSMGANQNSQSCAIYGPPANSAGPVLRAGLTEAFVTGIRKR